MASTIKAIFVLLLISCFLSCELQRDPETALSDSSFWNTDDNFKAACNQFFQFVSGPDLVYGDLKSDFLANQSINSVSDGSRLATFTSVDWDQDYKIIFTANKIIQEAVKGSFSTIDRWVGEAKFWRAYAYFDLVKKFGDIPLVLRVLDLNSPEFTQGRTDRALVLQQIYEDLDFAAGSLPSFLSIGNAGYGRISKGAAMALKARVALYFGTHQKFHNWGQPGDNLSKAIASAEAVMAEGYTLYTAGSYYNLFQYAGEGFANRENILSSIYGQNTSNNIRSHNIVRLNNQGNSCVTRAMIEQYLCLDGLPFNKSPLAEFPETSPSSVFKNKDPRMNGSIYTEGEPYNNPSTYLWNKLECITRYSAQKYAVEADWAANVSFVDIAMIRYAEVLLIYAEAVFELNGSISDNDLNKSINLLRRRVSMPDLTNAFISTNSLDMRTEIRREWNVELAQEGFRYDNIIRWKIAEDVLPQRVIGATYFQSVYGNNLRVTNDGYILVQDSNTRNFDPERDYLWPIPVREVALSGKTITQNPNWE